MILMKYRKLKFLIKNGISTFSRNVILNHLESSFVEIFNDKDGDDEDNEDDNGDDNEENQGDNDDHNNEKVNDDEDVEGCENNQGGDINDVQKSIWEAKAFKEKVRKSKYYLLKNI